MSKGYKCDACLECFAGDSACRSDDGMFDFCHSCYRAMTALCKVDPFHIGSAIEYAKEMKKDERDARKA